MKQTAVEWLFAELKNHLDMSSYHANEILEQAKEMEKEQILEAHGDEQSKLQDDGSWRTQTAEQYYNETFNTK